MFGLKLMFFLCRPNEFPHSCPINNLTRRTVDFHGELNADVRIGVMNSIKQATERANILVLKKCISSYITVRPAIRGHPWSPSWNEYLIHHKCWELLKDAEVLPLISKRFVVVVIYLSPSIHRRFLSPAHPSALSSQYRPNRTHH